VNATVVVLGEIGRSPRMQYHALALADSGAAVTLVGYGGADLVPGLAGRAKVRVRALGSPWVANPRVLPRPFYVVYSLVKTARLSVVLLRTLLRGPRADVLLVQSPPALPTLAIALVAARLRGSRLVIDWHNLGTPLLQRTLGGSGVLVRVHSWAERALARRADAHICVSVALQRALRERGVSAVVLYDRPAAFFAPTPTVMAEAVMRKAGVENASARPLVVAAPTGWTEEEDSDVLLRALDAVEHVLGQDPTARSPAIVVVLTGRGPRREAFERRAAERRFNHVAVRTAWLEPSDYPVFLGACDAGLSLHRSFSGIDLAMKVEDLLGSGLPVLALDHGAVREQLPPGSGGWLVEDGEGLARALVGLVRGGREGDPLRRLRNEVAAAPRRRFGEEWASSARAVLLP
jgi:beta-1,4-mannosyltransferase